MYKNKECYSGLVSFISSFNHEKKQKILLCEQFCHALGTRKKLQTHPIRTILSRPLNTKKVTNSPHTNNLVTPLEHEKSYKPPHTNNLVTPSKHEKNFGAEKKLKRKKFGAKKNSNFLIEINNKKNFLDPLRR